MDVQYLLEHNLMEAHKQFMSLCNEGYISTSLEEADDDQQLPMDGAAPAPDNSMPGSGPNAQTQMGNDPNAPMPPTDGGQQPPMDGPDPNAASPMGAPAPTDAPMGIEEPAEKDDVLDIEDLTQAQEKLNKKENEVGHDLGKVDSRIENLLTAVEKMQGMIDHSDSEIAALKAELQKRVPTQQERLSMRSLDNYPFNVNPDDYWKEKAKEGVYAPTEDNNQPEGKEYVITNKDVDDYSDSDIEQSFDDMRQSMKDIFKNW